MGRTIDPMVQRQKRRAARRPLPRPSVSMSLRLVIPWRVALQQSSPPLHQPATILMEKKEFEQQNLLKSKCENCDCLIRGVHPKSVSKLVSEPGVVAMGP